METWTYSLSFLTPVSIFSGQAVAGMVDRRVMRNSQGLPTIPGSTIKGRWRYSATRLLSSVTSLPSGLTLHGRNDPMCKDSSNACTICKLFGNPAMSSAIWVGQAKLESSLKRDFKRLLEKNSNPVMSADTELRPGIGLSRKRRCPMPDHLFHDEVLPAGICFKGKIKICTELSREEKDFLLVAARLMDKLGARKSVGRGILETGMIIQQETH